MFTREQFANLSFEEKKQVMEWRAKFHAKKAKATAEMKRIPKNGWNSQHSYAYARESDVKDMIREILLENNLSFSMDLIERRETPVQTRSGGTSIKTDVVLEFYLTDTETGYFEIYRHEGTAMDTSDKGIYKAYSNTIKYFLMDEFLIPTGDDVEKESPEIGAAQSPQPSQSDKSDKPTWKIVLDLEDELAKMKGVNKSKIREELEKKFGKLGKYKDMDEGLADAIKRQLEKWKELHIQKQQEEAAQEQAIENN